jgi:Right handed beta helix region
VTLKPAVALCAVVACACLAAVVVARADHGTVKPCPTGEKSSEIGTDQVPTPGNVALSPGPPECSRPSFAPVGDATIDDISRFSENSLRNSLAAVAAALVVVFTPQAAVGAELSASPSNLDQVFARAEPNDTILLQSGSYGSFHGGVKAGRVSLRPAPGADVTMALDFTPATNISVAGVTLTDVVVAAGSRNIAIKRSEIPGQVVLRDLTDSNVTLDGNVHRGFDTCNNCPEGRVSIPGDLSRPSGVTIENSEFIGGLSDGIQNGSNGTRILHNTFHDLEPGTPNGVHTDAIQLYGSKNTVIRGNYIHDVPDAIMAADGADHELIENNIIAGDRGGYPYAVTILSDDGSVIRHNTFADGSCMFNLRCGILRIGSKDGDPTGRGTVVEDNIVNDIAVDGGRATVGARSHNLLFGGRAVGPGEIRGKPRFVGGPAPSSRAGFALAPGSPGAGAAGDGLDIGAVIDRAGVCAHARQQVRRAARRVTKARRAVRRADGRRQKRHARAKLRKAKRRLRAARQLTDQAC